MPWYYVSLKAKISKLVCKCGQLMVSHSLYHYFDPKVINQVPSLGMFSLQPSQLVGPK